MRKAGQTTTAPLLTSEGSRGLGSPDPSSPGLPEISSRTVVALTAAGLVGWALWNGLNRSTSND
jgi:hypothetical protein